MEGIFYCKDVHLIGLLQEYIPVSHALSEEQVAAPLRNAYDMFLRPLLGDTQADSLSNAVKAWVDDDVQPLDDIQHAIDLSRQATVNLAFWYSFTELNTHITDQGFQRSEGETYKPIYRYQELELKQQLRNKGFNAVDKLLRFMYERSPSFPLFLQGEAWTDLAHALVRGPKEIDKYFYVHGSYLVYLKLRPAFCRIMELFIEPTLGKSVSKVLSDYLENYTSPTYIPPADTTAAILEKLREKVVPVVVCKALSEHVRNVGEITDRGLYYTTIQASATENQATLMGSDSERARQAANLYSMALHYKHKLIGWVEDYLPHYFKGHPEDAFNRDNDHKHTFWA